MTTDTMYVEKRGLLKRLDALGKSASIRELRHRSGAIRQALLTNGQHSRPPFPESEKFYFLSKQYLCGELEQIEQTRTLERAVYYVNRLKKALEKVKTSSLNDINLNRWKEHHDILTDSLWVLDKRDTTGLHRAWYWGNFIPQIPYQLMRRYTKQGEWVIDTFAGSGTTLLEAQRLGRNCLGVELQRTIARKTRLLLQKSSSLRTPASVSVLEVGDSATVDFASTLHKYGGSSAQLVIMHPPYHDIIQFSKNRRDLSNAATPESFVHMFGRIVDNVERVLDRKRILAVVIGDKYKKGEWIPLGFLLMKEVLKRDFLLKSIVVKNFDQTLGKRDQKELWRYRALAGGFYVFKHEYILIFQKK